ncbi:MAG: DegV family protein [Clostridia bacterium]
MSYRIFTDATSDLPKEIAAQLNVTVLPMAFLMEGREYQYVPGNSEMPIEMFYQKMRDGVAVNTVQINTFQFVEAFTPALEAGEDVIYIGFSSGLSGTIGSANAAAAELMGQYPERRIACIDSLCASLGEGLLVTYAARQHSKLSFDEMVNWCENNKRNAVHWFTVNDLVYLKRGGRVSGATAAMATVLQIKPVMHVDDEGNLVAVSKVQGRKKSLRALIDNMKATVDLDMTDIVYVGNCDCLEDANSVADWVRENFPSIKELLVSTIGTSIGAHAGPGTVALFFFGSPR